MKHPLPLTTSPDKRILQYLFYGLISEDPEPRPNCSRCGMPNPALNGRRQQISGRIPRYQCRHCGLLYSRLTGSPLEGTTYRPAELARMVDVLVQPLSLRDAADALQLDVRRLQRAIDRSATWLALHSDGPDLRALIRVGTVAIEARERAAQSLDPDPLLSAALSAVVSQLRATDPFPFPSICPHCEGGMVRLLQKAGRWFPMPQYRCRMCRRTFTRLTGTPLARTRWPAKQAAFIPYLGMPLQINQVAEALAVDFGTIDDWLRRYRALADASDATGQLASRIRLGATLAPDELCAGCGSNARVTAPDANHVQCKTCGRFLARLPVALVR